MATMSIAHVLYLYVIFYCIWESNQETKRKSVKNIMQHFYITPSFPSYRILCFPGDKALIELLMIRDYAVAFPD